MASNNFINECKTPAYEDRLGKIVIDGIEYNQANNLTNFEIENSIYNNGTIIGNTYTKSLKFSLINVDKDTEFVSKIANPSVGVKYDNNTTEYIDFDDYTIESLNDEQTKNFTDITGYDSLNTMDKIYVCGLSEGPHTVGEYWQDLLDNLGLETETSSFTNSDIVIPANPFVNNESNSVVLGEIEKVSCNFSRIEKRTRTVNNQEETYHVINLMWFNDDKGETATIDGGGVINNVDRLDKMKLIGNTVQNGTPTPESPVEVKSVTGRQVINVSGSQMLHETNQGALHWVAGVGNGAGTITSKVFDDVPTVNNQEGIIYTKTTTATNWHMIYFTDNDFKQTLFDSVEGTKYTISFDVRVDVNTNNNLGVSFRNSNSQNVLISFGNANNFVANEWKHVELTGTRNDATTLSSQVLYFSTKDLQNVANTIEIVNVKIELGETATKYTNYRENNFELNLGKQLFIYPYEETTKTQNGITFTDNGDGSITINGTATALTTFYLSGGGWSFNPSKIIEKGTYSFNKIYDNANVYLCTNFYDEDNNNTFLSSAYNNATFTVSEIQSMNNTRIAINSGTTVENLTVYPQLEKGTQITSFSPYKTPINLCGIGNYKDYIDRTTGKQLFNKNATPFQEGKYITQVGNYVDSVEFSIYKIELKSNTIYTLTNSGQSYGPSICFYDKNNTRLDGIAYQNRATVTFTTPNNTSYCLMSAVTQTTSTRYDLEIMQLEENNQATSYEPFGNNKWYICKNIEKYILESTKNWSYISVSQGILYRSNDSVTNAIDNGSIVPYCNYFKGISLNQAGARTNYDIYINSGSGYKYLDVIDNLHTTTNDFKNFLSSHNVELYYVLSTPSYIEIEDEELISQLNDIRLESGVSHISLSGDVTPTLEVNYFDNTPNYEFITSDYSDLEGSLTEYGPVNCVTLGSEDIGGENVFLQDEASIEESGETNVLINAEYFLYTQTLRQQAIGAIYNKLLGFRYYDLSLTTFYGKPFLQVGDKIRVNTNEGNVYDTYILKHTFTYDGTFKSVIESPSFTKQEEIVKSTESISSKIKRTEVMVDKANGQITSLTTRTDNLEQNTYTKTQTNELIQTAQTGLTNTFSEAGGNNIFRNTGLWFATNDSNNPYEFWEGVVLKRKEEKASNMSALLLQNNNLIQEQLVPNGSYTISFKYNRMIQLAVAKVYINDVEYSLSGVEETEFIQIVQVNSQHINIRFTCDRDSGFEIYDLMVNAGEVKLAYSQNQNETTTDTVNISKGITITSSDIDVTFKANADGIRTIDKNSNVLTQFTDTGMTTKRAVIEEKSEIVGTLWQEVGEQTWITKL